MRARPRQLTLPAPRTWGGKRKGAGRKPKGARAGVPHGRRPELSHRHPAHVTLRVLPHVWNLRSRRAFRAIGRAFRGSKERPGFRLVHFSVQGNHLHLIVEADDAGRLSRGMNGLATWIARRLNQLIGRRGKVFADRFHSRALRTPLEAARAVAYVLGNFAVHASRRASGGAAAAAAGRSASAAVALSPTGSRGPPPPCTGDPFSSAGPEGPALTAAPRTWLLRSGVRRAPSARPAPRPRSAHAGSA